MTTIVPRACTLGIVLSRRAHGILALAAMCGVPLASCNALNGAADLTTDCTQASGGCAALGEAGPDAPDAQADASPDAGPRRDASGDARADADVAMLSPCTPGDTTLLLCMPFEGNTLDGSGNPFLGAASNVAFVPGAVGQAGSFSSSSVIFPYHPRLDVDAVTIEAFVRPLEEPKPGMRMGILDSDARFGIFLMPSGMFQCNATAVFPFPRPAAPARMHLACTGDGMTVKAYVNGILVGMTAAAGPLAKTAAGMSVGMNSPSGDPLLGSIDELRVWSRVRTDAEIAAAAARGQTD